MPAQQLAEVAPIGVREPDVEDDGIEGMAVDHLERLLAAARLRDREAFMKGELLGQLTAEGIIVVDDQDAMRCRHMLGGPGMLARSKGTKV